MDVSIIIPSKNGIKTIERCLRTIKSQRTTSTYEIIVVDSGSSDETITTAEKYGCKIIKILPQEFSHGYSRNLGADKATGKILVFLNQDAIPQNETWMEKLVGQIDDTRVAAFSRQVPYPDTHDIEKVFLNRIYSDFPRTINENSLKKKSVQNHVLFSTVSAAIKKDIFNQFKFSEKIIMSEDQELAARLIKSGYSIQYVPESVVIHSHSYSACEVFKRYFDSGRSLYSISDLRGFNMSDVISEECSILFESFQSSRGRPLECVFSIVYLLSKSIGFALGTKANFLPKFIQNILSHTVELKRE
jgi:glycosyltransferase involved in cell wall biosynthesis